MARSPGIRLQERPTLPFILFEGRPTLAVAGRRRAAAAPPPPPPPPPCPFEFFDDWEDGQFAPPPPRGEAGNGCQYPTWTPHTGTWAVITDAGGEQVFVNDEVGVLPPRAIKAPYAGPAEFNMEMRVRFDPATSGSGAVVGGGLFTDLTLESGYVMALTNPMGGGTQEVGLERHDPPGLFNGGSATTLFSGASPLDTDFHTVRLTRNASNLFELFLDEGSVGTFTDATYPTFSAIVLGTFQNTTRQSRYDRVQVSAL